MQRSQGKSGNGHWARLDSFLWTDPRDCGCDLCRQEIEIYAELSADGKSPELRFPRIAAHLVSCHDCREDLTGLVSALSEEF